MKLENFTDLQTWAVEQWGDAKLGDRRTQRAIAIGAAIAANPQVSLPDMMQGWNQIRAAYRLFAAIYCALAKPNLKQNQTFWDICTH